MRGRASRRRKTFVTTRPSTRAAGVFLKKRSLLIAHARRRFRRGHSILLGLTPFGDPLSITPRLFATTLLTLLRAPIPLIGLIKSPPSRCGRALPTAVTTQGTRRVETAFAPLQQTKTAANRKRTLATQESPSNLQLDPGSVNSLPVKSRCRILLASEAFSFFELAALPAAHLLPA